jgi:hypothetical protein
MPQTWRGFSMQHSGRILTTVDPPAGRLHPGQLPGEISAKPKAYAFERSLGIPPAEACRRAGGKVANGQATKWEQSKRVQSWIAYYRSLGCDVDMVAAKRTRIEQRLELAAYGNIFDFCDIDPLTGKPVINWDAVAASPYSAIISGFKFDKGTGVLVDFERDNSLQALAQLRDMHGFKAVTKTALTDPSGNNPASLYLISEKPMSDADWEKQRAKG